MTMSLRGTLAVAVWLALVPNFAQAKDKTPTKEQLMADIDKGKDLYATFDTTLGTIVVRLYTKEAPKTVANFVGLATGAKPWTDRKSGEQKTTNFYDGLTFHRVIPGFMAQGGDPLGSGMGDPGYKFADENQGAISKAGILAMANAGPNTNGSQFFITEVPQPRLETYNRFGEVVSGQDIVYAITHVKTGPQDRPVTPVLMKKVTISETAPKA